MKFADLKPDDPWFVSEETRALTVWLEEQRTTALKNVVLNVREDKPRVAAEYVGHWDSLGRVLNMIRKGEDA